MYRAKAAGRGAFAEFTPEMNDAARKRLKLTNELRNALRRNELSLHYQPQISLRTGGLIGAEALLRWRHPEWGSVSPAEFIPVAEESGLIEAIGAWVIDEACRQVAAWDRLGLPPLTIAVNCSTRQFQQPQMLHQTVREALQRSGLQPSRLELEITETVLVQDIGKTRRLLEQFRALGVRIAVDDFGTGYSSLYYLKRLPIDKLKVDKSFVRELESNSDDRTIAASVAALGHSLGLKVIAEGVETSEQLRLLESMHCDEAQGYLWSRPLPADEFPGWVGEVFGVSARAGHGAMTGFPTSAPRAAIGGMAS
jgi:EAL domain-containing protein (putative c-di-GMP-specific phosphodiesterase class I)